MKPAPRAAGLLAGLGVTLAAFAVFAPTIRYAFLNWDDNVYVLQNPWIRSLDAASLRAIFTQPYFQNYLPLHLLSYMVDHALWGVRASGYHLSSVLVHALNALLCLVVVRRLSGSLTIGTIAALLFALHPAHVEAVAWISSRKELLSTTFLLLSLDLYLRARRGVALRPWPYAASVLAFLFAMLSKVSAVVLPGFLLILDLVPPARGTKSRPSLVRAVLEKIPYAIVGIILIYVNSRVQVAARAAYAHDALRYLSVKGHAVWNYLALLLGADGNPDYDLPELGARVPLALLGWLVLPAAAWLLLRARRRLEFLGVCWTFLALFPALAFPLVTYMADRYLYAPSIGFCWVLAGGLTTLLASRRAAAWGVTAAIAVFFAVRTHAYSPVWRNSESLWTYALTKSRDFRVYNNLAEVRIGQKRYDEAERLLRRGAAVENVTSYQSLGVLYYSLGRYPEALRETDRAIAIQRARGRPDATLVGELHYNRGAVLWQLNRPREAAEEWRAALRANPKHAGAREWLGVVQGTRPPP